MLCSFVGMLFTVTIRFGLNVEWNGWLVVLAAAALHALDHHVDRLAEDHAKARALASGLQGLPGVTLVPPQSNIVFVDLAPPKAAGAVERLRAAGVLCSGSVRLRLVTHLDVSAADIERAVAVLRATL